MELNATGVTITTMKFQIQLPVVAIAFAGARIDSGVISAGYSQVIPNHPTAKKLLKTNKKTAAKIPVLVLVCEIAPASTNIEAACPVAPNNINFRRPNFSMVKMAMNEARKYSVPLHAARSRERNGDRPMLFWKTVAA